MIDIWLNFSVNKLILMVYDKILSVILICGYGHQTTSIWLKNNCYIWWLGKQQNDISQDLSLLQP